MTETLVSTEPATGAEVWSGPVGDAAAEVAAARAAWPEWAAHSVTYRMEALRRFANVVRAREEEFADLIARETGKPFWEAKTEVDSVIAKVEISINAYSERTPTSRLEAAMGNKVAVRHKPHGVLAVLGPYNFPAHLPNGHIVPALIAGNAVVFKPSEKTPATGAFLVECFHEAGIPEGVRAAADRRPGRGQRARRTGWNRRPAVHRIGARRHGAPPPVRRNAEQDPRARAGRQQPDRRVGRAGPPAAATIVVQSAYLSAGPALHRGAAADRRGRQA